MDWQTPSQYALGALSEAKVGETGIHHGIDVQAICLKRSINALADQNPRRLLLRGHT